TVLKLKRDSEQPHPTRQALDFKVAWQKLKEGHLPQIMTMVAWNESSFNSKLINYPTDKNPDGKGELGLWQFMPDEARRYGLSVDDALDTGKSTEAFVKKMYSHLNRLHQDLKLSLAEYNGTAAALKRLTDPHDYTHIFWDRCDVSVNVNVG